MNRHSTPALFLAVAGFFSTASLLVGCSEASSPPPRATTTAAVLPTDPSATPVATRSPATTPVIPGLPDGMGYPRVIPDDVRSATWIADTGNAPGSSGATGRTRLAVGDAGDELLLATGGSRTPTSTHRVVSGRASEAGGPPQIGLLALADGDGCHQGDFGRYLIGASRIGHALGLNLIEDECATRATLLARSWARALDRGSLGGAGIIDAFQPGRMVSIQLPEDVYTAYPTTDFAWIESEGQLHTLLVLRNPYGLSDPCSDSGGAPVPIEPTIDAFRTYMAALPGFTVDDTVEVLDGRRAVHLTVPSTETANCPSHRVVEFGTGSGRHASTWFLRQGGTDSLYVTEVPRDCVPPEPGPTCIDLFLLQWLGGTLDEERSVLSTIAFITSLPTND